MANPESGPTSPENDSEWNEEKTAQFEALTQRTMQKCKELTKFRRFDESYGKKGIVDLASEYLESLGMNARDIPTVEGIGRYQYRMVVSTMAFLFEARPHPQKPNRLELPISGLSALEVGGFNYDVADWLTAQVFHDLNVNYTGIDLSDNWFFHGTDIGTKHEETGKLNERLAMDALEVKDRLKGRKYEFILGFQFLGYPTDSDPYYEKPIIESLNSVLREGGFMVFFNREPAGLSGNKIEKMGCEVVETIWEGETEAPHQAFILRKPPREPD